MVPEGWADRRISDLVISFDAGVSVNSEEKFRGTSQFKILKTSCVSVGVYDSSEAKAVVNEIEIERLREPVLHDSIIISRMNTPALVGANAYIEIGNQSTFLPDRLWQIKIKNNVFMRWLGYWFASTHTRYMLGNLATGTSGTMKNITKSDVFALKIRTPPLQEQKKIALILSTWDKAIATTEELLANSQQQKKSLMQQLLTGKKRLLGFSGEWMVVKVSQIGKVVTGSTPPKSEEENYGGSIFWATAEDFRRKYINNTRIRLTESGAKKARVVPAGSVLVTCIASIGKNAIAADSMATNQQINSVIVNKNHCNEYLYYLVGYYKNKLIAWAGVTAVPILNKSSFEKVSFFVPCLNEQQKIASVLSAADREIETFQQKLECLKQEKKALMQQLLIGKRRVKIDADEAA